MRFFTLLALVAGATALPSWGSTSWTSLVLHSREEDGTSCLRTMCTSNSTCEKTNCGSCSLFIKEFDDHGICTGPTDGGAAPADSDSGSDSDSDA